MANGHDLFRTLSRAWTTAHSAVEAVEQAVRRAQEALGPRALEAFAPSIAAEMERAKAADARFRLSVDSPEITIATTGTTSGGKSTIINFLVGAPIMPVAVQEMSAGVVTILHHPSERAVTVARTQDSRWETGTWTNLTDLQIQARLKQTMDAWRACRDRGSYPPAPSIEVRYPTRLGAKPERIGLPSGIRLRLLDLPGLNSQEDEANRTAIQEGSRQALCLVAYDSTCTDKSLQRDLLAQVVEQVKSLGGSPRRMLFVLNRIDVFLVDRDGAEQRDAFVVEVTRRIREELSLALPEHRTAISELQPQPFASGPASLAAEAQTAGGPAQVRVLEDLTTKFRYLFDKRLFREIGAFPEDWDHSARRRVAAEAEGASYVPELEARLGRHIAEHLPELVLPTLVADVVQPLRLVLTELDAALHAYRSLLDGSLQEEQGKLEALRRRVDNLRAEVLAVVQPFRALETVEASEAPLAIERAAADVGRSIADDDVLAPMRDVRRSLGKAIEGLVAPLESFEDSFPETIPRESREALVVAFRALRIGPAGVHLAKGGIVGGELEAPIIAARREIQQFFVALSVAANASVNREASHVANRVRESLDKLLIRLAEHYAERVERENPGFVGMRGIPSTGGILGRPPAANIRFRPELDVLTQTVERQTGTRQVKKGTERRWYTLFLKKHDVYETVPIIERRTLYSVSVPPLGQMIDTFLTEADVDSFGAGLAKYISEQMHLTERQLSQHAATQLARYERHLQHAWADAETRAGAEKARADLLAPVLADVGNRLTSVERWREIL
jgi:hypothetical protein